MTGVQTCALPILHVGLPRAHPDVADQDIAQRHGILAGDGDLDRTARLLGRKTELPGARGVRRADADEARAASGFAIGGTPPFGHPAPVRTVLDPDLLAFGEIWAAAGAADAVFALTPSELRDAAGATVAAFREERPDAR